MMRHAAASCFRPDIKSKRVYAIEGGMFANLRKTKHNERLTQSQGWLCRFHVYYDYWQTKNYITVIYSTIHAHHKVYSFEPQRVVSGVWGVVASGRVAFIMVRTEHTGFHPHISQDTGKVYLMVEPSLILNCLMHYILHNYQAGIQYWHLYSSLTVTFITPYH